MHTLSRRLVAPLIASALAVAACGSSDDAPSLRRTIRHRRPTRDHARPPRPREPTGTDAARATDDGEDSAEVASFFADGALTAGRDDGGLHAGERERDDLLPGRGREPLRHGRHRRPVLPRDGRRRGRHLGLGRRRPRPLRPRRRLLGDDGRAGLRVRRRRRQHHDHRPRRRGRRRLGRHRQLVSRSHRRRLVPPAGADPDDPRSSTRPSTSARSPRSASRSTASRSSATHPSVADRGGLPALDACGGHIDPSGYYHWHFGAESIQTNLDEADAEVTCDIEQDPEALIGFAYDGYADLRTRGGPGHPV